MSGTPTQENNSRTNGINYTITGDPGDMMFGTYMMGLCLLDPPNRNKTDEHDGDANTKNPLYMNLESDWKIFADYMIYKVHHKTIVVFMIYSSPH